MLCLIKNRSENRAAECIFVKCFSENYCLLDLVKRDIGTETIKPYTLFLMLCLAKECCENPAAELILVKGKLTLTTTADLFFGNEEKHGNLNLKTGLLV